MHVCILVVDREGAIREVLTDFLKLEGYQVISASSGKSGLSKIRHRPLDVVITETNLCDMSGLEFLSRLKQENPRLLSIIMTEPGTADQAIDIIKAGAYDTITKPLKVNQVLRTVKHGLEQQRLERENINLKDALRLYHVSERMAAILPLPEVIQILIDTARLELRPDALTLLLTQDKNDHFTEIVRWLRPDLEITELGILQKLPVDQLMTRFRDFQPVLLHDDEARDFFPDAPSREHIFSFLSLPLRSGTKIIGLLNGFAFKPNHTFEEGKRKMLSILANRASVSIENARLFEDLQTSFKQTIQAFANIIESKDQYTRGHSDRVRIYAGLIASALKLPRKEIEMIKEAALMHDIGKLGLQTSALNKPDKLTSEEKTLFKQHPTRGRYFLQPISLFEEVIPSVYSHHENWNGTGYPEGLKGSEIPLHGRIMAVADAYDAMTSDRAYRKALSHEHAIKELEKYKNIQFDPRIVEVFVEAIEVYRREQKIL